MLRFTVRGRGVSALRASTAAVSATQSLSFLSSSSSSCSRVGSAAVLAAVPAQLSSLRLNSELATSNPNLAPQTTAAAAAAGGTEGSEAAVAHATEIARRVNATKRAHQTATGDERKRLELAAWQDLNSLTEDQIAHADGQATAILLNAWGYFARFWARGRDGPL